MQRSIKKTSPTSAHMGLMSSPATPPLYASGSALGHVVRPHLDLPPPPRRPDPPPWRSKELRGAPGRMDAPPGRSEEHRGGWIRHSSDRSSSPCSLPAPVVRARAVCFCAPCTREGVRLCASSSVLTGVRPGRERWRGASKEKSGALVL